MTSVRQQIASSIFQRLDEVLAQPDCKTARQLVRSEGVIYDLRFNQYSNPLQIRSIRDLDQKKGNVRSWLSMALILLCAGLLIYGVVWSVMEISGLSLDGTGTSAASQQTTAEPHLEFYSVED